MGRMLQSIVFENQGILFVLVFVVGCVIGSFLNVCIHRIPRKETVVSTPSHCPKCKHPIPWHDNIPLVSYLVLRGRCRSCGGSIAPRYPLVEGLTGALYLLIFMRFGPSMQAVAYSLLTSLLLISSFTDLERDEEGGLYLIIPDLVTVPGTVAGVLFSLWLTDMTLMESLMGVLIGGGALYLVMRIVPRGMGEGDTKLTAMMGAFLGWEKVLIALYLGVIIGAAIGVILIVLKVKGRKDAVPFGPFLSVGGVLALFYGSSIISRFLSFPMTKP